MKVRTRYAPSPTGNPHLGNIRTALFAYLFAKSKKGEFFLRIEDTDQARFVPESLKYIEESLAWLGIKFDGERVFQSDRLKYYSKFADKLVANGYAYKCFCTSERLEKLRTEQTAKMLPPGYDRCCLKLSHKEIEEKTSQGEKFVIRLKIPETGSAKWEDLVRGTVEIEYKTQDDPIILKSDGWPTYHLANVIDDHEMGITDVIRGEEWIPSTPKHIALYKYFGWDMPNFAHLPVILGPDKSKLSKRHGDTAILDYRENGYLPAAMVNFLALLGWNPGTEEEFFSMDELAEHFDFHRVQKAPAVFDIKKLDWINGNYIRLTPNEKLKTQIQKLYPNTEVVKLRNFDRILEIEKTRLEKLSDILEGNEYFYQKPKIDKRLLVFKKSTPEDTNIGLREARETLEAIETEKWNTMKVPEFENILKKVVEKSKLSNGDVFWPVRFALSGKEKSPSPAELLWALGKEESIIRLKSIKEF